MRLYLLQGCPFAHRASFALQEKGLAFEPIFFPIGARPPELAAVGPHAKSPTLFDGETKVWAAEIVLEYLEDRHPAPALLPKAAGGRAEARMLVARVARELEPLLGAVATEWFFKPPAAQDPTKIAAANAAFVQALPAWNDLLADRPFLVDGTLTLADIVLFTPLHGARPAGVEIPAELAHLTAWFARMSARPASPLLKPAA